MGEENSKTLMRAEMRGGGDVKEMERIEIIDKMEMVWIERNFKNQLNLRGTVQKCTVMVPFKKKKSG